LVTERTERKCGTYHEMIFVHEEIERERVVKIFYGDRQ
jgi:hypothetical protein